MAALYPRAWIQEGNAVGSGKDGARAALERISAGADGILFHGSPPRELAGVLESWRGLRPESSRRRSVNPGL
jgi:hypothetical protein